MTKSKKKKNVKKIIVDTLFSVFIAFVAILISFSIIDKATGKSLLGHKVIWIYTGSMETTIPERSYILCKDKKDDQIEVGDIITFVVDDESSQINGKLNTHRVVRIENDLYYTKGDANLLEDGKPTKYENIVSIYEKNLPFLTFFGRLYATPAGFVITIVGVAGLMVAWFVIDYRQKEKEKLIEQMIQDEVKRLEEEKNK